MVHRARTSDVSGVIAMFICARGLLIGDVGRRVASPIGMHRARSEHTEGVYPLTP